MIFELCRGYLENRTPELQRHAIEDHRKLVEAFSEPGLANLQSVVEATLGEYKNGRKEGTWTYWYSTGEKKRESTYRDNKKEGTTYYWHQNGQMAKEITYRDDKNIDQKLWDDKGNRLKNPTFESFK